MLGASYYIENDRQFAAEIERASSLVGDLRTAFALIARDWFKSNKAQFSLRGAGQYKPLSERYARRKRLSAGKNLPILVGAARAGGESGRLRDSVTDYGSADSIVQISEKALILGSRVPYGIYHQSDAPRTIMPLRKFLFIGPEAPRSAPSAITGRLERWTSILVSETNRKLK